MQKMEQRLATIEKENSLVEKVKSSSLENINSLPGEYSETHAAPFKPANITLPLN